MILLNIKYKKLEDNKNCIPSQGCTLSNAKCFYVVNRIY